MPICPKCGKYYHKYPALTRRQRPEGMDDTTWEEAKHICSECGSEEAMFDFWLSQNKNDIPKKELNKHKKEERKWLDNYNL